MLTSLPGSISAGHAGGGPGPAPPLTTGNGLGAWPAPAVKGHPESASPRVLPWSKAGMHVDFPQSVTLLAVALAEITIRTTGVRLHQTSPSPRLQDTRSQPLQTSHKDRTFTGQHPVPLQDLPPPQGYAHRPRAQEQAWAHQTEHVLGLAGVSVH